MTDGYRTSPAIPRRESVRPGTARPDAVTLAGFAAFALFVVACAFRHDLTLDEAHAWNIARLASTPLDTLFIGAEEGHTPLWHLVLWPFARSGNPHWMPLVGVACALVFAWFWLRDRPVGAVATLVVLFGYFTAYRYPTIVRTYTLLLPALAVLCIELRRHDPKPTLAFALAGFVALDGALGTLLSLALLPVVADRCLGAPSGVRRPVPGLVPGLAIWVACAGAAAAFVLLPVRPDNFVSIVLDGKMSNDYLGDPVLRRAVFPHADVLPFGIGFFLDATSPGAALLTGASLAVVASVFVLLSPWRAGQLGWALGVAGIWLAARHAGLIEERHSGHLVLAAIALCWVRPAALSRAPGEGVPAPEGGALRAIAGLLVGGAAAYHVVMTMVVGAIDLERDTSHSRATVALLDTYDPARRALVLTGNAFDAAGVIAYRDRPVHDSDCDCTTRYRADTRILEPPSLASIEAMWCALIADGHDVIALFPDGRHRPDARHEVLGTIPWTERFDLPMPLYRLSDPETACPAPW